MIQCKISSFYISPVEQDTFPCLQQLTETNTISFFIKTKFPNEYDNKPVTTEMGHILISLQLASCMVGSNVTFPRSKGSQGMKLSIDIHIVSVIHIKLPLNPCHPPTQC
jgi:hypothetical protein